MTDTLLRVHKERTRRLISDLRTFSAGQTSFSSPVSQSSGQEEGLKSSYIEAIHHGFSEMRAQLEVQEQALVQTLHTNGNYGGNLRNEEISCANLQQSSEKCGSKEGMYESLEHRTAMQTTISKLQLQLKEKEDELQKKEEEMLALRIFKQQILEDGGEQVFEGIADAKEVWH